MTEVKFPQTDVIAADVLSSEGAVFSGCKVREGEIFPALTARKVCEGFNGITYACYSAAADRFFVCADGKLYASSTAGGFSELTAYSGNVRVVADEYAEGVSRAVILTDSGSCIHNGVSFTVMPEINPELSCGAMRCGRLFGADRGDGFKLRWSGRGGALDGQEGIADAGWVYLDRGYGKILNILVFGEKVVAVREFGLTLISAYGIPENFKVESRGLGTDRIIENSAAVCAGRLLFFTESGLYCFDGNRISRVDYIFDGLIADISCSAVYGGDYFAGVAINGEKKVFVYCADGLSYLVDAVADAFAVNGGVYCFSGRGVSVLENGGEYAFTSGKLFFGSAGRKVLSGLNVRGFVREITVESDGRTRTFNNVKGYLPVHMCGCSFKFTLRSNGILRGINAYVEVKNDV